MNICVLNGVETKIFDFWGNCANKSIVFKRNFRARRKSDGIEWINRCVVFASLRFDGQAA